MEKSEDFLYKFYTIKHWYAIPISTHIGGLYQCLIYQDNKIIKLDPMNAETIRSLLEANDANKVDSAPEDALRLFI